jgi:DNA-binding transcriptional MerR regulator
MKNFTIRELENFSQVKAHTIRIWEQRYSVFNPKRNEGNFRRYNLEEVKLLLDIALLIKSGFKISCLVKMSGRELEQKIDDLYTEEAMQSRAINDLIVNMFSSGIEEFEDVLDSCVHLWEVDITIQKIVIPFLERVQLLSYNDNSNDVHFVVTAVRKKIILGIEKANPSLLVAKSALLFLEPGEHYDLMLLYTAYILKCSGLKVLYLGTNVPAKNLETILVIKKPDFLFSYIPQKHKFKMHNVFPLLDKYSPGSIFFVVNCEALMNNEVQNKVQFIHYKNVPFLFNQQPVLSC